ncbi:MAG: filamentous hemagglutinin N-terminal domain-containing protein, partial [Candidatus Brocadiae bacterium]|nr:filamentous hemagglutinin N-terminal domain-containing protein [Candidatus Brocadiia bacterium]
MATTKEVRGGAHERGWLLWSKPSLLVLIACMTVLTAPVHALPTGGAVVAGSASLDPGANRLDITQATDKVIINYADFSIARGETVQFFQPSSTAAALNRVPHGPMSQIAGQLLANGRIFLINPSGIVFHDSALVDVHSLVASALDISNMDFLSDSLSFQGVTDGVVQNFGQITAGPGGDVFLIGPEVLNEGRITAPQGSVGLAGGSELYLTDDPFGSLVVEVQGLDGRADNAGVIEAAGGHIGMYGLAVNQDGLASADSLAGQGGFIELVSSDTTLLGPGSMTRAETVHVLGDRVGLDGAAVDASAAGGGGTVLMGGDFQGKGDVPTASRTYVGKGATIKADAIGTGDGGTVIVWADEATAFYGHISARGGTEGGDGGFAEVSARESLSFHGGVDLGAENGAHGSLLLDPKNITVAFGGGAYVTDVDEFFKNAGGDESIHPDTIAAALASADVTLAANTDIFVNDPIDATHTPPFDSKLWLQAGRSITIDADIHLWGTFQADANCVAADGMNRDPGSAEFLMTPGTLVDASAVYIQLGFGPNGDDPQGDIILANVIANDAEVDVYNVGPGNTIVQSNLYASDTVLLQCNGPLEVSGSIETGGGDIILDASEITVYWDGSITNNGLGDIYLTSTSGDIIVSGVFGYGLVSVQSAGCIYDGGGGLDIAAPLVELVAQTGIGWGPDHSDELDIDADTLAAMTQSGPIEIEAEGAEIVLGTAGLTSGVHIVNGSVDDYIEIMSYGPLTVASSVTNAGGGLIVLGGRAGSAAVTINAAVSTTGGDGRIDIAAGGDLIHNATVATEGGDIWMQGFYTNIAGTVSTNSGNIRIGGEDVDIGPSGNIVNNGPGCIGIYAFNSLMHNGSIMASGGDVWLEAGYVIDVGGSVQTDGGDIVLYLRGPEVPVEFSGRYNMVAFYHDVGEDQPDEFWVDAGYVFFDGSGNYDFIEEFSTYCVEPLGSGTYSIDDYGRLTMDGLYDGIYTYGMVSPNGEVVVIPDLDPVDQDDLGMCLFLKSSSTLSVADLDGRYNFVDFSHDQPTIDPDEFNMGAGYYTFDGAGSWTATTEIESPGGGSGTDSGTYTVDALGRVTLQSAESGTYDWGMMSPNGEVVMVPDTDLVEGTDLGMIFLVKASSGLSEADLAGRYTCVDFWHDTPVRSPTDGLETCAAHVILDGAGQLLWFDECCSWGGEGAGGGESYAIEPYGRFTCDEGDDFGYGMVSPNAEVLMGVDLDDIEDEDLGFSLVLKSSSALATGAEAEPPVGIVISGGASIVNTGTGGISLIADGGDVYVSGVDGGGLVSVQSAGAIHEGMGHDDIVAPDVELIAVSGIGDLWMGGADWDELDVDAQRLAAVTNTGGIYIDCDEASLEVATVGSTSGLTILSGTASDGIEVMVAGLLTITADVTNTGGGSIALGGMGASPGLVVDGDVTGSGRIDLFAGGDMSLVGDVTADAGDIWVHADNVGINGLLKTNSGGIRIDAGVITITGSIENSGTAPIELRAADDIWHSGSVYTAGSGDIWMEAGYIINIAGSVITDGGDIALYIRAPAEPVDVSGRYNMVTVYHEVPGDYPDEVGTEAGYVVLDSSTGTYDVVWEITSWGGSGETETGTYTIDKFGRVDGIGGYAYGMVSANG